MWIDGQFWFWCLLMLGGFAYVGGVLCHRPMPLASRGGGYGEIIKLLASLPLLYALGPRHNLKPPSVGIWSRVLWTGLGYAVPFFVALHWFFLQRIPQINYSLTQKDLTHMHPVGQAVFICGGLLIAGLTIYHVVLAHRERILLPYLSGFIGSLALFTGVTAALQGRYYLHVHHYFLFGFFIPFTRFKNPVSLVCQAICAGVYVEGVSEWSMAPLWYSCR